jgi:uncharacterized membrane protein
VAVVLGVLVAAAFGSGDFLGGRAAASVPVLRVLAVSQACSLVAAAGLAGLVGARVAPSDLVFGALAGAANVTGLALLYRGLAGNAAGVVAPVTAVVGALVPVAWGLARGERPSVVVLAGAASAIAAGAVIAREPGRAGPARFAAGAAHAVAAGGALGTSLVLFASTSDDSGMWPVLTARAAAFVLVVAVFAWYRSRRAASASRSGGRWRELSVGAGLLDVGATAMLVLAVRRGLIVVVAPIASLAPAFTVLLARVVLHERLHPRQRFGLALALAALVLVAAG